MSGLPAGWATTELGALATFEMGQAPSAKDCNTDGVGSVFVKAGEFGKIIPVVREWTTKPLKFAQNGDVLICVVGATAGKINLAIDCAIGRSVAAIRPDSESRQKYIYHFLASQVKNLRQGSTGSAQGVISKPDLAGVLIPLAPEAEQARIAEKLDELLAQVDTLKARIDGIPALLKRFRQSVLAAAVSGRLTEEWRAVGAEKNANYQSIEVREPWSHTIDAPTNWTPHIFEDVITLVGGSQPPKSEFIYEEAPGLVRLIQIRDYKSDNHTVFIRRDATKKFCSADDVMIGRYGPPIFQILRGLAGAYNVALMKAVPLVGVLQNEYMYRYLQDYKILNFVEAGSDRTAGQSGVNKAFLEKYPIFLPPLAEQTEIVRRVEQLFTFADQLETKVASAKSRIDHLTQSILAKAFRGELVPQDPNDEPASVLLERIKTQRAAAPKAKRGRKSA